MPSDEQRTDASMDPVRRKLLGVLGAAGFGSLAGCTGGGGGGGGTTTTVDTRQTATTVKTSKIKKGGTLKVAMTSNPSSFDPPYSSGVPSSFVQNFFYESLITQDTKGNVYPWVAQSYELANTQDVQAVDYEKYMVEKPIAVKDGTAFIDTDKQILIQHPDDKVTKDREGEMVRVLTVDQSQAAVDDGTYGMKFTYNLQKGVTFTNGEELTSQNVVDSYKRVEGSKISAQVFNTFLHAEAPDKYTVNLYAQTPDAEAERQLPGTIFPSEHMDLGGGKLDPRQGTNPIGSGPWKFKSFENKERLVVERRDDYWVDDVGLDSWDWWDGPSDWPTAPVIDKVEVQIVPEPGTRSGALNEGEVDLTYGLTPKARNNFQASKDYKVKAVEAGGYQFMQFPVNVAPFDKKKVRQAVNHLIPRKRISNKIEKGWTNPAWIPLPELAYGAGTQDAEALKKDLKPMNKYDPKKAKQLINEAGVETPIKVQMETNKNNKTRVKKVELIAQSMNQTGLFDVTVETFEFGKFVGRILSKDYWKKGNIFVVGLSGTFNPGGFCTATHHSRNWGQCCNSQKISYPKLDKMMDNARFSMEVLGNTQERAKRYDKIWHKILELNANSYIDIGLTTAVHKDEVVGFNSYPFQASLLSYGLWSPVDQQITYLDR